MHPVIVKLTGDPLFWGAVMGVCGVVLGHWVTRKSKKEEHQLAVLQATVTALDDSVQDLRAQVKDLEGRVNTAEKKSRVATEKYSVALTHAATLRIAAIALFTRPDSLNVGHVELPPVPALIEADMRHQWPSAFDERQGTENE